MKKFIPFLFTLVVLAAIPQLTLAAKQVSQYFSSEAMYFPLDKGAIMFSKGSFYYSRQPTTVNNWQPINISADRTTYFLPGTQAVSYKNYDYVISGATTVIGEHTIRSSNEILRLNKTDPTALKIVFSASADGFVGLVVFKGALFASDGQGKVWKTTNGTKWKRLSVTGFPEDFNSSNFLVTATATRLYGIYEAYIYTSTNGSVWKKMEVEYQGYSEYEDYYNDWFSYPVVFAGKVYLRTYDNDQDIMRIWRITKDNRFKKIFEETEAAPYSSNLFASSSHLYLSRYDRLTRQVRIMQLSSGRFTPVHGIWGGPIWNLIEVDGKELFLVGSVHGLSLWRYRTVN